MKKRYLVGLFVFALVAALSAPQAADAAWWNPFSWFRKPQKEAKAVPPIQLDSAATTSTSTGIIIEATTTPLKSDRPDKPDNSTAKPLPAPAKPPVATMPVQAKPVAKTVATTSATSSPKAATTTTEEKKVEVPSFAATAPYLPSNFSQPKNIRQGTEVLAVEASHGDSGALGLWYVDSVTWRIVSDEMRSGDLTIGVSSRQSVVSDSSSLNASITTKLGAHVASDELSFRINGPLPSRGRFHVVVEKVTGHMKNDSTNAVYEFEGLPVIGPEFKL